MTISNPTMSRNAVAMSTMSFAGILRSSRSRVYRSPAPSSTSSVRTTGDSSDDAMSRDMNEASARSVDRFPECRWLHGASDDPGECDDREHVRDHLDELRRDELQPLQADLHRLGGGEQEAGNRDALRVPLAKDDGRKRDESTPGRHAVSELMLVESEVHAAKRRADARQGNREPAYATNRNADGDGCLGLLACCAHAKAERCSIQHPPYERHRDEPHPHERVHECPEHTTRHLGASETWHAW